MAEQAEDQVITDGKKDKEVDYEALAKKEGWRSKEELGDDFDAARYVGAEEFLKRKPLFETIKQQSKAIKRLEKTVDSVVSFSQKNAELAAKKAIADLNAQKKEAIEKGDVDSVTEIDKNIEDHKKVVDDAKIAASTIPAEITEWATKNPWFDTELEMQDFATAYCASYKKRNPTEDINKVLEETEKAVKRAFPDSKYFKSRRSDPPAVETHKDDAGDTGGNNKKYTMSRLTEEQKLTYNAYVKKSKMMTHDAYFQKLEEIGALEK